ncbi:MAG: hypothetical protein ACKOA8_17095 [Deltaproteobacteria bacterium]
MNNSDSSKTEIKFINKLWPFVIATLVAGPFALPLLWRNPRYQKTTKILVSAGVILFTLLLIYVSGTFIKPLISEYQQLLESAP